MKNNSVEDKFTNTVERWKQFNWFIQILIGGVGLIVVISVSFGFYRAAQLYRKYVPLLDASMEMRLEATTAYLWFEEMLGGDKSKKLDDILMHLDFADWYAGAMLTGGESSHLKLLPLKDLEFHDAIRALQSQLEKQRELLNRRMEAIPHSGPGSDLDKSYHSTLENFIKDANEFEMQIKGVMSDEFQIFKFICAGVIICCVFLFLIIGYGFYRYENVRRKSYTEILQMERMLVQSEKMAALGTMIAGIAHEVNNPNNFISFNIPILKEYLQKLIPIIDDHAEKNSGFKLFDMPYQEFREDIYTLLDNIENGSDRINRIVSDLKEFSRKKDNTTKVWFDIKTVIQKAVTICGSRLNSLVESFEINLAQGLPKVYCDPEIVELILINFLINAAEAADKKNSWVKLNAFLDERRSNALVVEVTDNGSGISESNMGKIFDPFFSTKSSRGGTGMGLYLCLALAGQMGARIEVDSRSGQGSTFRLIPNGNEKTTI